MKIQKVCTKKGNFKDAKYKKKDKCKYTKTKCSPNAVETPQQEDRLAGFAKTLRN